jgi:hypothetical protein
MCAKEPVVVRKSTRSHVRLLRLGVVMANSRSGGGGGMTSDDVGDMRGRVQLMNDDRKALMESTQSIIKQNKELLKLVATLRSCPLNETDRVFAGL